MNSSTRLLKESRVLFWPWCLVTIGGAVPLIQERLHTGSSVYGHLLGGMGPLSIFVGIPLLATLSLGCEFQYGTFSLLLTQPLSRMRIWAEKMSVTVVAVASAALIQAYLWWDTLRQDTSIRDVVPQAATLAVVLLAAVVVSAAYWTLVGRSTMGGLALTILVPATVVEVGEIGRAHV